MKPHEFSLLFCNSMAKYFGTFGKGMEPFVEKELKMIQEISALEFYCGRVCFEYKDSYKLLLKIGTLERIFYSLMSKCLSISDFLKYQQYIDHIIVSVNNLDVLLFITFFEREYFSDSKTPICFRINIKSKNIDKNCRFKIISLLNTKILQSSSWIVNLRHPDLEICIHILQSSIFIGIPISSKPISSRIYDIGLRTTVANAMHILVREYCLTYDIILDPFCGKGTILFEGVRTIPSYFIGSDIEESQLQIAKNNCSGATSPNIDIFRNKAEIIPFRNECVDAIVTDIPFGNKYNLSLMDVFCKLDVWLNMFYELLKINGVAILLISNEMKDLLEYYATGEALFQDQQKNSFSHIKWSIISQYSLSLGKTDACIITLRKTK